MQDIEHKGRPASADAVRMARPARKLRSRSKGRYPGLRVGRVAFPCRFRTLGVRWQHSGGVTRPFGRLPLRGQHRNCFVRLGPDGGAPVSR